MKNSTGSFKILLIGGSAGSLPIITKILKGLPEQFDIPIIIIVHRQKNVPSEMNSILNTYSLNKKIIEPEDKEPVDDCCIYLAPQNYHLLIEHDKTFSLDYSELVQYSRPSIDVTFDSAASVYKNETLCILLSGANNDGSNGIKNIIQQSGSAIVQDPATAEYKEMPQSALEKNPQAQSLSPDKIIKFVRELVFN